MVLALLCAGYGWRRNGASARQQLGLHVPKRGDWLAGISMALAAFCLVQVALQGWAKIAPPEQVLEQTASARALFAAYNSSLLAGFAVALLAAVGEELFFRGALQPWLGNLATSLLFTALHSHVWHAPLALALLFGLSLSLGYLRGRCGTAAAIIAHGCYNFLPFLLAPLLL